MKKILSLLGSIGLIATSSTSVVSCDKGYKIPTQDVEVLFAQDSEIVGHEIILANNKSDEQYSVSIFNNKDDAEKAIDYQEKYLNGKNPDDADCPNDVSELNEAQDSYYYVMFDSETYHSYLKGAIS